MTGWCKFVNGESLFATGLAAQVGHLVTNDGDWLTKLEPLRTRVQVDLLSRFQS